MRQLLPFFILLSLSLCHTASGQKAELHGQIKSPEGPAAFATLYIDSLDIGATADEQGHFIIPSLPSGRYVLTTSYLGFQTRRDTFSLAAGEHRQLNLELEATSTGLEQVVVIDQQTGIQAPTPYLVSRVSTRDIQTSGQASGIMGQLETDPAVSAAMLGQGIAKPFIRGLGFSRVVTIFQGNKLENHQWGADHGLGLNELGISRADIIKGPASVLYGSGALGGVILLQDDEQLWQQNQWRGEVGLTLHSNSLGFRPSLRLGRGFESGFFVGADAAMSSHADYKDGHHRSIGNSRFDNHTVRLHAGYKGQQFENRLSYTYLQQNLGIIEDDEMLPGQSLATTRNDRELQLPFQEVEDHVFSYAQKIVRQNWVSHFHLSHHINYRKEIEERRDQVDLGLIQHHSFYNGRLSWQGDHALEHTFGLQGSWIQSRNMKSAEEILIPDASIFEQGFYYMSSLDLGSYYIQGGLRYDYRYVEADASAEHLIDYGFVLPGDPMSRRLDTDFTGWTGSLGVSRFWKKGRSLRLNLSSGYRAPDLAELFSNGPHPGTNRFEMGNAEFDREQSLQLDLNYSQQHGRWTTQASTYINYINNFTFFAATGEVRPEDGLSIWAFEQAPARLYGGELSFSYDMLPQSSLRIQGQAAWFRGERRDREENLTFVPQDHYSLKLRYQPTALPKVSLSTRWQWFAQQNRPGFNEEVTDAYQLWDIGAQYQWQWHNQSLEVGIRALNLLNETYLSHMSILRAFEVTNPGRNLMLNLRYSF